MECITLTDKDDMPIAVLELIEVRSAPAVIVVPDEPEPYAGHFI